MHRLIPVAVVLLAVPAVAPRAAAQIRIGVDSPAAVAPGRRVPLDSGEVVVTAGRMPTVRVRMAAGTFSVHADTATLRQWAEGAAALPAPPDAQGPLPGVQIGSSDGRGGAMRLARLPAATPGDGAARYRIEASNGAWVGRTTVSPAAFAALAALLRGDATAGSAPVAPVQYFEFQVDQPAKARGGNRPPSYPEELRRAGLRGTVQLQYVVGVDGRVQPESVMLLGSSAPEFARAAHDAILSYEFTPAKRGGAPVPMIVQQGFNFALE